MSVADKSKADCSGCNACAEACPKHCIEMISDKKDSFIRSLIRQFALIAEFARRFVRSRRKIENFMLLLLLMRHGIRTENNIWQVRPVGLLMYFHLIS